MPPRTSTTLVHYNRHPHLASPSSLEPARRCSIESSFARGGLVEVCTCRCYCRTIEEPATTTRRSRDTAATTTFAATTAGQKISTSERKLVRERWIFTVCLFLTDAKVHWFVVVAYLLSRHPWFTLGSQRGTAVRVRRRNSSGSATTAPSRPPPVFRRRNKRKDELMPLVWFCLSQQWQTLKMGDHVGISSGDTKSNLDKYLEDDQLNQLDDIDVLTYWKEKQHCYGELAKMACDVLSIPITSVASESAFSIGAHILNKYRNRLLPKKVQALICTNEDEVDEVRVGASNVGGEEYIRE
nr:zinc finger BED domain-containing protein DAYSLEEPER-like [Ipomoea batatas]